MICYARVLIIAAALALSAISASYAAAPAGEIIYNQAFGSFIDNESGGAFNFFSNASWFEVDKEYNFSLLPLATEQNVSSGQQTSFIYELTNNGNTTDYYQITPENIFTDDFDYQALTVYHDKNGDGALTPDEPQIVLTPVLNPGEKIRLILTAKVPDHLIPNLTAAVKLTAVSVGDGITSKEQIEQRVVLAPAGTSITFIKPADALQNTIPPTHPDLQKDTDYQDAQYYLPNYPGYDTIKDGVYIQAVYPTSNQTTLIAESVQVTLKSEQTGDALYVTLTETGVNTGVFRSAEPVVISAQNSGNLRSCPAQENSCWLKSQAGDTIKVELWDTNTNSFIDDKAEIYSEGAEALNMVKTSEPACNVLIAPGSMIKYTISLTNNGRIIPSFARKIFIDGNETSGILIEDEIPANVRFNKNEQPIFNPADGIVVIKRLEDTNGDWTSFGAYNGSDIIRKVGVLIYKNSLLPGKRIDFIFNLKVNDAITPGTIIRNTAYADLNGDGAVELNSGETCNTLQAKDIQNNDNKAEIIFLELANELRYPVITKPDYKNDNHFLETSQYRLDTYNQYDCIRDGVYVEVRSTSLNLASYLADECNVTIKSINAGDEIIVAVKETGVNTGIFRSDKPIRLSKEKSGVGESCSGEETAGILKIGSKETMSASIPDHDSENPDDRTVIYAEALVDPLGSIFNSFTGTTLPGAIVSVRNPDGAYALDPDKNGKITGETLAPQTTGADGWFQYARMYPGTYYIDVIPPAGYIYPTTKPPTDFPGWVVNQYSYGKDGYGGLTGLFTLNAGDPPVRADIPVDDMSSPTLIGVLRVKKTASTTQAQIGDFVGYTIKVKNSSSYTASDINILDSLPLGFAYVTGSLRIDGVKKPNPSGGKGPNLKFHIDSLTAGQETTLQYVAMLKSGAAKGDGINKVNANSLLNNIRISSAASSAKVAVEEKGLFSSKAIIFGRLYLDNDINNNESNRTYQQGELPVSGVRLYLEDGTKVVTDENGEYIIYGLEPVNHVIKVDSETLPKGVKLKVIDNRNMGDPKSRLIDLVAGEFHRADFAMTYSLPEKREEIDKHIKERNAYLEKVSDDAILEKALSLENQSSAALSAPIINKVEPSGPNGDVSSGFIDESNIGRAAVGHLNIPVSADKALSPLLTPSTTSPETISNPSNSEEANETGRPDPKKAALEITKKMGEEGTWLFPKDNISRHGSFMVVIPDGISPKLFVNGEVVADSSLGAQIANVKEQSQIMAWYGVKLLEGENLIEVKGSDMFGNERVLAKKSAYYPSKMKRIRLVPAYDQMDADDGKSELEIIIRLEDEKGIPVTGTEFVTLETTNGKWRDEDIQPKEPGYQTRIENGIGKVYLLSSGKTGDVKVRGFIGANYEHEITIAFIAPLRPLLASGLLDLSLNFSDTSSPKEARLSSETDKSNPYFFKRGAFFLKGRVKGDALLTLSYDSEKDKDAPLFKDLKPEDYYPIYGDTSPKGYEAQSRSKIYVKLEKDKNSIMWGDYDSDTGEMDKSLGRFKRSLTGANLHYENNSSSISVFGAETEYFRKTEELRANGTAAFYRLTGAPIKENSESITLITKDSKNISLVINSRNLTKYEDYVIDYWAGHINFYESLPTSDDKGNPIYIRISYDTEEKSEPYFVGGVRLKHNLNEKLSVGGGYAADEHPEGGYNLAFGFVSYKFTETNNIIAEMGMLHHKIGEDDGSAFRLEWQSHWREGLDSSLTFQRTDKAFNPKDGVTTSGRQEIKAEVKQKLNPVTDIKAEALQSEDIESGSKKESTEISLGRNMEKWRAEAGLRHTIINDEKYEDSFNTGRVRLERQFNLFGKNATGFGQWEEDLSGERGKVISAGGDYFIHDRTKMYIKGEYSNSLESGGITALDPNAATTNLTLGLSSTYFSSTEVYGEQRIRGGINAQEREIATGIKRQFVLQPDLTFSPQIEYTNTQTETGDQDAFSISLGLTDTRDKDKKSALRAESRWTEQSRYWGLWGNYAMRIDQDWSAMLKEELGLEDVKEGEDNLRHTLTFGLAKRPDSDNRYHFLGMYQWKEELNQNDIDSRSVHLLSVHNNYQKHDDWIFSGRAAAKWQKMKLYGDSYYSNAQLLGVRAIWDMTERFDSDVYAGLLSTDFLKSIDYSVGLGLHFLVKENWRLGVRYTVTGFTDKDLDAESLYTQGIKFGLQWKFDEDLFYKLGGWLFEEQKRDK